MEPPYDVYELIGEGSFGKVYRAQCNRTNSQVAYKVISKVSSTFSPRHIQTLSSTSSTRWTYFNRTAGPHPKYMLYAENVRYRRVFGIRILFECCIHSRLTTRCCSNAVLWTVDWADYDFCYLSPQLVVITEFAEKDLCHIIRENGVLEEHHAREIICDLVSALFYLHSNRVLHRFELYYVLCLTPASIFRWKYLSNYAPS